MKTESASPLARFLPLGLLLLACYVGSGYASETAVSGSAAQASAAAGPRTAATKTITNFTQALRCMDELFLAHGKQGTMITSAGVPDETGKIRVGTKEMLISALATMTAKSHAFEFIDFHGGGDDLARLFDARGNAARGMPDYYIRGSITQLDDSVVRSSKAGGFSASRGGEESIDPLGIALGISKDQAFDLMGMDMSMGDARTRQILPVTVTSNTMVTIKESKSGDSGTTLGKVGLSFSMDRSRNEGQGAAARALLELSLIETLGKFTGVPYWRCLDVNITHPLIRDQARLWYDRLQEAERILFVQRKLGGSMNRYHGPLDGIESPILKQSVAEYQAAVGLVASGQINFDVYASLIDDVQNSLAALPAPQLPSSLTAPMPASAFSIALNSASNYRVGEFLNTELALSSDGTAYCYYEEVGQKTSRIFPNQFQPDPTIKGNRSLRLAGKGFKIRFDHPGREKVACIAANRELLIPRKLIGAEDLTPLPVESLAEVIQQFLQINPSAVVGLIDISVEP